MRADKHTWFRDTFVSKGRKQFHPCANKGHENIQVAGGLSIRIVTLQGSAWPRTPIPAEDGEGQQILLVDPPHSCPCDRDGTGRRKVQQGRLCTQVSALTDLGQ